MCLKVKKSFDFAYYTLTRAVHSSTGDLHNNSILFKILKVSDDVVRYRMWVQKTFGNMLPPPAYMTMSNAAHVTPRRPRSLSSGSTSSSTGSASCEVSHNLISSTSISNSYRALFCRVPNLKRVNKSPPRVYDVTRPTSTRSQYAVKLIGFHAAPTTHTTRAAHRTGPEAAVAEA